MGKSVAVLGLGRFGKSLAVSLADMGADVMAVDKDQDVLSQVSDFVTLAIEADLMSPDAVGNLGLENMDVVVVSMGADLVSSINSVMVAKEKGVPKVYAKAGDKRMGMILEKVGADIILYPEEESGDRTAKTLMSDSFMDYFDIDQNLCMIEMKPYKEWIGKTLIELDLRAKYKVNVVALKNESGMHASIDPNRPFVDTDEMLVLVEKKDLGKLKK